METRSGRVTRQAQTADSRARSSRSRDKTRSGAKRANAKPSASERPSRRTRTNAGGASTSAAAVGEGVGTNSQSAQENANAEAAQTAANTAEAPSAVVHQGRASAMADGGAGASNADGAQGGPSDSNGAGGRPGREAGEAGATEDYMRGSMTALHQLLSKLGGSIDDASLINLMAGGGGGGSYKARYMGIVDRLASPEDDDTLLVALEELSEMLAMSQEEHLVGFPLDTLGPVLVRTLQTHEGNPSIMLYAARVVTWLADILPQAGATLARHGIVTALCGPLVVIGFMDVAEQCITALEKLSAHVPELCLRQGGMTAVLSYLDFFPSVVQRSAVSTAAAMAARTTLESMDCALAAMPQLLPLLDFQDHNIVDSATAALDGITNAAARDPTHAALAEVASKGLLEKALALIDLSSTGAIANHLSPKSFFRLVSMLTTCASGSPDLAHALLNGQLHVQVHKLLEHSGVALANNHMTSAVRTQPQLTQVLKLMQALLPSVPQVTQLVVAGDVLEALQKHNEQTSTAERVAFMKESPEFITAMADLYLPLLHQIYSVQSAAPVRGMCISGIVSILNLSTAAQLTVSLADVPLAMFVKSLLSNTDPGAAAAGLTISALLLSKVPDLYAGAYSKEGTVAALRKLSMQAPAEAKVEPVLQVRTRAMSKVKSLAPPPPAPAPPTLSERCGLLARATLATHFSDSRALETPGLVALKRVAAVLSPSHGTHGSASTSTSPSTPSPTAAMAAFQELVDLLVDDSSVSAFELQASAAVPAIIAYVSGSDLADEGQRLERLHGVSQALLVQRHGTDALSIIARKLVSVLETMSETEMAIKPQAAFTAEHFTRGRLPNLASMSAYQQALFALSQPMKLTLQAADSSELAGCVASTVLVEPLAKLSAVEDFLYSRWQAARRAAAIAPARRAAEASASAAAAGRAETGRRSGRGGDEGAQPARRRTGRAAATTGSATAAASNRRVTRSQSNVDAASASAAADASARTSTESPPVARRQASPDWHGAHAARDNAATAAMDVDAPAPGAAAAAAAAAEMAEMRGLLDERTRHLLDSSGDEDEFGVHAAHAHDEELDDEDDFTDDDEDDGGGLGGGDQVVPMVEDLQLDEPGAAASGGAAPGAAATPAAEPAGAAAGAAAAAAAAGGAGPLRVNRVSLSAAEVAAAPPERRVVLMACGRVLPRHLNVLQAVTAASPAAALGNSGALWGTSHTLQCAIASEVPKAATLDTAAAAAQAGEPSQPPRCSREQHLLSAIAAAAHAPSASAAQEGTSSPDSCLVLLRLLEAYMGERHHFAAARTCGAPPPSLPPASNETFFSTRTNARLLQQLADVVAVCGRALPEWLRYVPSDFKCLLPFETRRRFLMLTSFDIARTLNHMNTLVRADGGDAADSGNGNAIDSAMQPEMRIMRSPRQKVRVSRSRIRDSALKVFSMASSLKNILEFEFFNEAGTGLGPTLEFYTLLATELQKKSLGMWRDHMQPAAEASKGDSGRASRGGAAAARTPPSPALASTRSAPAAASDMVYTTHGLFPKPYAPGACPKKVLALFEMLGKAVAKCLQDGRLMDIDFAPAFLSAILRKPLDFSHLEALDPGLASQLLRLKRASRSGKGARRGAASPHLDGASIEDLCLNFTLPGYPGYELLPGGGDKAVKASNCEAYCDLVVAATLEVGVRPQLDAFIAAFDTIFDSRKLQCLYESELELLLRGQGETWTPEYLLANIKCDHGYTSQSRSVRHFVDVLCGLPQADQRTLLRFVTGSPRLPPGGLAALRPPLTVVMKQSSSGEGRDEDGRHDGQLPSVMTCANYIKLPPYSSKDVCARQLRYALLEGQGSFDLS